MKDTLTRHLGYDYCSPEGQSESHSRQVPEGRGQGVCRKRLRSLSDESEILGCSEQAFTGLFLFISSICVSSILTIQMADV